MIIAAEGGAVVVVCGFECGKEAAQRGSIKLTEVKTYVLIIFLREEFFRREVNGG